MKFKIRHADKIVGTLIVFALLFLATVIFLLGSKQHWLTKKYYYVALMESALGIGENMPILYKGLSIGNIESIRLNDDNMVEVRFYVLENYRNRVREGSLVEVEINPIGLGNQFFFYSGLGDELEEGAVIPAVDTDKGRQLTAKGLSNVSYADDSISSIIIRINSVLDNTNNILLALDEALTGTDSTSLGRIIGNAETTLSDASSITFTLNSSLKPVMEDAKKAMGNIETITKEMSSPDGALLSVLDPEGQIYKDLEKSLSSLASTLDNIEKTTSVLPAQWPNIEGMIEELRIAVKNADDVLESMKNNPLLKRGIPDKANPGAEGTSPRNIGF